MFAASSEIEMSMDEQTRSLKYSDCFDCWSLKTLVQ